MEVAKIASVEVTIEQLQTNIEYAQQSQNELIQKGQEIHEQELLNYHEVEVGNDSIKEKAIQKKLLERINKKKLRNYSFKYLTRNIGKGKNSSMK